MTATETSPVTFSFGDSPEMADALLELAIAGIKIATCGAMRDFAAGKEAMPVVGRHDVILDGRGEPAAIIETLEVTVRRFCDVDAAFAYDEGEGDRTLEDWKESHKSYFERHGGFSPEMELVCERFKLVEIILKRADRLA